MILLILQKSHWGMSPTFFYFISKIAYVVKKLRSALAGSFLNRFLRFFKSWKFGSFCIFCINKIFWNFEFLDPNFHIFGPRTAKNQQILKIPIQWSQKLSLATFLLITFSKKNVQNFFRKKKNFIFFFFLKIFSEKIY